LVGNYVTSNFILHADSSGHVELTDPMAAMPRPVASGVYGTNLALFGNYIAASFVADGIIGGVVASATSEPMTLAHPPDA
jgi:hypothetical protein